MKLARWNYLGPRSTPQEIRDLRKSSFDAQRTMGMPVIHKHRWTEIDVREGRAQHCPYHDVAYDQDSEFDPYCFGTGYLGGWADGIITFITIADTQEDQIRIGEGGVLLMETHPNFTAPWTPNMGDGDLLITGDFDVKSWDIITERERYLLEEVTPRTIRGFQHKVQTREYKIQQEGMFDKLPHNHPWYNVPIIFDYNNLPPIPVVPPGGEPGEEGFLTTVTRDIRISAIAGTPSSTERELRITTRGDASQTETSIAVAGKSTGVVVVFEGDY